VLLLLMASAYALVRASETHPASPHWLAAAYGALGLGVAYKIVPIVAVPFLWLAERRAPAGERRAGRALLILGATALTPFAIQWLQSGSGVFGFVTFHTGRGIQLESLWATVMALGGLVGVPVTAVLWTGGVNLTSALAPAMLWLSTAALVAFIGGLFAWFARRHVVCTREDALRLLCFVIAGAVILAKVLSPQYFVWALPLTLLVCLEVLNANRRGFLAACVTIAGIAALTTWVFPYHYFSFRAARFGLESPEQVVLRAPIDPSFLILGVRNVAYLALLSLLGTRLLRRTRRA
jgi:hypothetical protein